MATGLEQRLSGATMWRAFSKVKPPVVGVESGYGTLVVEIGIGGLVLWPVMSTAILFAAWRVVRTLQGSPCFPFAFVFFWYAFLLLFPLTYGGIQSYEDYLLHAYFGLLLGLLFRLLTIALSAQFAVNAALTRPTRCWIR